MKNIAQEITNASAWIKTSQFISEKFGKQIEYRFLVDSDEISTQSKNKFYISGDDLVIPLKYKQTQLGNVVVSRGATLSSDQQTETVDLVQFLIEPQVYSRVLKLQINSLSNLNMQEEKSKEDLSENVVPLFSKNDEAVHIINSEDQSKKLVSKFIHIRSKSKMTQQKVALKIHEMIGTIAFLRLQDIYSGAQSMSENEVAQMDLSETTIYVENIKDLNLNQLNLVQKLSLRKTKENFAIIVGSDLEEKELQSIDCSPEFKKDLIGLSYDADRVPFAQQASAEVLDLLFFNDGDIMS